MTSRRRAAIDRYLPHMLVGIDHLVIAVDDPDEAAAQLELEPGLAATGGGRRDRLGWAAAKLKGPSRRLWAEPDGDRVAAPVRPSGTTSRLGAARSCSCR
jgi:hypothetical protein